MVNIIIVDRVLRLAVVVSSCSTLIRYCSNKRYAFIYMQSLFAIPRVTTR